MSNDKKNSRPVIGSHRKSAKDQQDELLGELSENTAPNLRSELGSSNKALDSISLALKELEEFKQTMTPQELKEDARLGQEEKSSKQKFNDKNIETEPEQNVSSPKKQLHKLDNLFGKDNEKKDAVMQEYLDEVVAPGKDVKYSELEKESRESLDALLEKEIQEFRSELTKDIPIIEKKSSLKDTLRGIKNSVKKFAVNNKMSSKIISVKKEPNQRSSRDL